MVGETVEKKLYNAASNGDLTMLQTLLQEDPYLVESVSFACSRNAVHIAALRGQVAIVEEVLNINPQLARNLDSEQSSPLHVAAAQGNIVIVRKLLSVAPEACWWRDCHDMNPIHIAAMNGHDEVLKVLLEESHLPAMERLHRGQTVFHLCVKHGQLMTMKVMVEKLGELVHAKDDDGETLLHLAARSNQLEIVKYLVQHKITRTQTPNSMGKTELKILRESKSPGDKSRYSEIKNMLKKLPDPTKMLPARMGESVLVVLVLIATMAFQAGIAPPGGVWDENKNTTIGVFNITVRAGEAIMESTYGQAYMYVFVVFNTIAFVVSLLTILLIMTGLPFRSRGFSTLAMIFMFASAFSVSVSYTFSIIAITPGEEPSGLRYMFLSVYFIGGLFVIYFLVKGPVSAMRE
ncbi:ankyrin repeat-containing protein At5g02620-like isoform X2 [Salvia miltiorrhiza]|uniref:ankyrin repeat-containing protein At5g02620-like isoform X2 n=1 Tax=Salvia miltiorrhiza TaxID=226208 RepID=UPI0025AC2317|nr:ankyrin repeat-containing protein At5g02620-like isoform X2 [Salvia miltiorrhiza]